MLAVGQVVYYSERGQIYEGVITKVGKKYFYVEGFRNPILIDTMREKSQYSGSSRVYFSAQEILDEKEMEDLYRKIAGIFRGWSNNFTLEQLRDIDKIIEKKEV